MQRAQHGILKSLTLLRYFWHGQLGKEVERYGEPARTIQDGRKMRLRKVGSTIYWPLRCIECLDQQLWRSHQRTCYGMIARRPLWHARMDNGPDWLKENENMWQKRLTEQWRQSGACQWLIFGTDVWMLNGQNKTYSSGLSSRRADLWMIETVPLYTLLCASKITRQNNLGVKYPCVWCFGHCTSGTLPFETTIPLTLIYLDYWVQ